MDVSGLVCPVTKVALTTISEHKLATTDGDIAYPIEDGIPVLLGPEAITNRKWLRDLKAPQYAEAYAEMDFYNSVGNLRAEEIEASGSAATSDSISMKHLFELAKLPADQRMDFPNPPLFWACDNIEAASEVDCYQFIGSVRGRRVVQVGGSGTIALLLLLAGAAEAILLTPMTGEARVALANAKLLDLPLRCVVGIGEELPFEDEYADVCYVGGCIHHMRTEIASKEIARILRQGGKLAAIEPWKAPGYSLGTKIFGKREANPFCSPMTAERLRPFREAFSSVKAVHHGALTRYPTIVAQKAGFRLSIPQAEWVTRMDDAVCDCIPGARSLGSGLCLLATK